MLKLRKYLYLSLFLTLLLIHMQAECSFVGDRCSSDEKQGTCISISNCKSLVEEIHNAGRPMPSHMVRRLQKLTCGYDTNGPLVCCISTSTEAVSTLSWNANQGITTPNRGKPESSGDRDQNRPNVLNNNNNNNNDNDVKGPPDVEGHPNLSLLPTTDCGAIEDDKIVGGNKTKLFQMPWMVLLSYRKGRSNRFDCGGTLINKWYVLTAAHCVSFLGNSKLNGVLIGEHDVRRDPDCETIEGVEFCASNVRNVTIDTIIAHPGYTPQTLLDDVALIRLSEPADFSLDNLKPLCLPITSELQRQDLSGQNGVVAGWGLTEMGLQSPVLLSVALPILKNKDCIVAFKRLKDIKRKQMCAGGIQEKDSCGGDSGGPLMYPGNMGFGGVRYVQHGIVSHGSKRCGIGGFPGIFTRVAYYMDWILNNMSA